MQVKFNGEHSKILTLIGGGSRVPCWEALNTLSRVSIIPVKDRFEFIEDLSILELVSMSVLLTDFWLDPGKHDEQFSRKLTLKWRYVGKKLFGVWIREDMSWYKNCHQICRNPPLYISMITKLWGRPGKYIYCKMLWEHISTQKFVTFCVQRWELLRPYKKEIEGNKSQMFLSMSLHLWICFVLLQSVQKICQIIVFFFFSILSET